MAIAEVSVGGLVMSGIAPATWIVEKDGLGGWFDGPPVSATVVDHPGSHGTFATPGYRRGRVVTLQAVALAATVEAAGARRREAAGLLGDGTFSTLTVTEPDGHVTTAAVRIDAQPLVAWRPGWDHVRAQWQFYAPDPYRYGETVSQSTGLVHDQGGLRYPLYSDGAGNDLGFLDYGDYGDAGFITVTNAGSAQAATRFSVDGPAPLGFTITETGTGRRLVFPGPVGADQTVTIDSATGRVLLDGAPRSLSRREWTPVEPGGARQFAFSAPSGSPTLTVEVTETWW